MNEAPFGRGETNKCQMVGLREYDRISNVSRRQTSDVKLSPHTPTEMRHTSTRDQRKDIWCEHDIVYIKFWFFCNRYASKLLYISYMFFILYIFVASSVTGLSCPYTLSILYIFVSTGVSKISAFFSSTAA